MIILCIGRTIHAISVSDVNEDLTQRRKGMRLTIFSIYIQVIGNFILYFSTYLYIHKIIRIIYLISNGGEEGIRTLDRCYHL